MPEWRSRSSVNRRLRHSFSCHNHVSYVDIAAGATIAGNFRGEGRGQDGFSPGGSSAIWASSLSMVAVRIFPGRVRNAFEDSTTAGVFVFGEGTSTKGEDMPSFNAILSLRLKRTSQCRTLRFGYQFGRGEPPAKRQYAGGRHYVPGSTFFACSPSSDSLPSSTSASKAWSTRTGNSLRRNYDSA